MNNSLVYIHKGYSWYVPLALRNGRRFYGKDVYFIGDAYGCFVARMFGVRAHRLRDYHFAADEFAKVYRHHSTLGYDFELFCIQRWFVLLEFLKKTKRDSCIYLDTDVLLTRNLSDLVRQALHFGLTFTGYSAHVCFVNHVTALEKLCNYIMSLYSNPANEERLRARHEEMAVHYGGGGVSDMTMFWWMQKEFPDLIGDYPSIFGNSPIDVSMDDTRGFEADGEGFKKLVWAAGQPSAILTSGELSPLWALHHQGKGKEILKRHYAELNGNVSTATSALDNAACSIYKFTNSIYKSKL
jgi:hypothetical protein